MAAMLWNNEGPYPRSNMAPRLATLLISEGLSVA
jgi:hypothetical protein